MGSPYHGQGVGDALSCRIQESLIVKLEGGLMVAPEEGVLAFPRQLPSQSVQCAIGLGTRGWGRIPRIPIHTHAGTEITRHFTLRYLESLVFSLSGQARDMSVTSSLSSE